jgi:hypothetical protein
VYLAPTIDSWQRSPRSTFVIIATDAPLNEAILPAFDAGDGIPLLADQLLTSEEVVALLSQGRAVTLTDRYAPVDQMLAPVFREEVPR